MPDLMPRHVQRPRDVVIVGGSLAGLMHDIMFERMSMPSKAYSDPPPALAGDGVVKYRSAARIYDLEPSGGEEFIIVHLQDVLTGKCDSVKAELVIGADGIHSAVWKLLRPMRWSCDAAFEKLMNSMSGKRIINWLWYYNINEGSPEATEIFTDIQGRDQMLPHMAAPFADLIRTAKSPFVTKVNDVLCTERFFSNDRVFLVGDASTSVRPHLAASTDHTAWQCLSMAKVFSGELTQRQRSCDVATESKKLWLTSRIISLIVREVRAVDVVEGQLVPAQGPYFAILSLDLFRDERSGPVKDTPNPNNLARHRLKSATKVRGTVFAIARNQKPIPYSAPEELEKETPYAYLHEEGTQAC
ncbi:hypothetical protein FHL15_008062 [Xylaria flabelliformis]|uniref:2,6-dihydroxypyridine 3-monooxygenase substrate binding domain-containing protein n=1 Tax=Xylaria flabelliformis TaxID=2512241 RepID=A0A553HSZ7_9PEZI|nr:hypothetical protein FHL15_008062 [Xylaria flabelliformis]